jgi:hypothetical protein
MSKRDKKDFRSDISALQHLLDVEARLEGFPIRHYGNHKYQKTSHTQKNHQKQMSLVVKYVEPKVFI